jgi:S1-C subfamily serine protease
MSLRLALTAVLFTLGCRTAPVATLPGPLPEAGDWNVAENGRAFLGLRGEENSGGSLEAMSFDPGVRVLRVIENSPAANAGLSSGDVILEAGGQAVDDPGSLDVLVQRTGAESELVLSVLRGDSVFAVTVALAAAGGSARRPQTLYILDPVRSRAGWTTTPDGVRLTESDEDGPFVRAGLPPGSLVQTLDGEPVLSARALVRALGQRDAGAEVSVQALLPDGSQIKVDVTLYELPRVITELGVPILFDYQAAADGSRTSASLLDLWFFQLFQYRRDGGERRWVLLELFGFDLFEYATGMGELTE